MSEIKNMAKDKKILMVTILVIALVHMPTLALTPAINQIQTTVFPDKSLSTIQTVMGMPNLISPFASIIAAFIINQRIASKKAVVIAGLCVLGLTGVLALFFHTQFWHLIMLSVCIGIAIGTFVTNNFGLLFDNFSARECEIISGFQTSCINSGGIIMCLFGGILATSMWYGGYVILLIGFPIAVLASVTVPRVKPQAASGKSRKGFFRMHPMVYFYGVVIFIFMMIYSVCGSNISTHIAAIGTTATSGIATAIQMAGGVVAGIFFGKISAKLGDYILVLACAAIFIGFIIISSFQNSLPMIFVGIFITGSSLSMIMPRCTYCVSNYVDESTSAPATSIISSIAPSLGGFLSPIIFTNITHAIAGDSTVFRYRFVGVAALILGIVLAVFTAVHSKKAEK